MFFESTELEKAAELVRGVSYDSHRPSNDLFAGLCFLRLRRDSLEPGHEAQDNDSFRG